MATNGTVGQANRYGVEGAPGVDSNSDAIISVRRLRKHFPVGNSLFSRNKSLLKAVDDVSFDVERGKTMGLVGESGCGKTTTLKVLLGLEEPTDGQIFFEGEDVATMSRAGKRELRSSVQAVFQDPWASLNPRMRVGSIIGEPLEVNTTMTKKQIRDRVAELLQEVGLPAYQASLFPHEFSGGQRQRIGVARALSLNPKVIVLDEPVSALDVSIRAQIMNLLVDLQREHGLAYLMVAHNLATVRYMCDRMAVMYLGVVQKWETPRASSTTRCICTPTRCFRRRCPRTRTFSAKRSSCRAKWCRRWIRRRAMCSKRARRWRWTSRTNTTGRARR